MKPCRVLVILACLVTLACSDDPARSLRIIARPPVQAISTSTKSNNAIDTSLGALDQNHQLEFCPPPAEGSLGASNFIANGPCGFQHRGNVSCESLADDFIVAVTRKAKHGATLVIYLNVEQYHGPASYDGAQMFVAVQTGTTIYRWSSESVHATVGPGEAFVLLPATQLEGEAAHVDCSRLIGPESNFQFQCDGTSDAKIRIDSTNEAVFGRLQCTDSKKANEAPLRRVP